MSAHSLYSALFIFGCLPCSSSYAALVGSHYILAAPKMASVIPVCVQLQQNLNNYLIKQNILFSLGLSRKFGCTYTDTNLATLKPHISLLNIPSNSSYQALIKPLQNLFANPLVKVPPAFSFGKIEAFLPTPGSNKIFVVIRTPSVMSNGFFTLQQHIINATGIKPTHAQFKAHISLGTLTTTKPGGFTAGDVTALYTALKNFKKRPNGTFEVESILLSPFKVNQAIHIYH